MSEHEKSSEGRKGSQARSNCRHDDDLRVLSY